MKQKVVIKVSMKEGDKSRSKAMKFVARFSGVMSIELQGEDKSQLVIIGEGIDAVELTKKLRKNFGYAEMLSVSPVDEKKTISKLVSPVVVDEKKTKRGESWGTPYDYLMSLPLLPEAVPRTPPDAEEGHATGGEVSVSSQIQRSPIRESRLGIITEEWHDEERILLTDNLPQEPPICPKLIRLSLGKNYKLRKIPSSFFINMPLLQHLDLSDTGIMSLPKSLFDLATLKELLLRNCEFLMMLPPQVGNLKCLEVLDMEGTEIINLPVEIKELSLLRRLRVSFYGGCSVNDILIPFGVISALSQLVQLYIGVNPDDERWDACVESIINEVCGINRSLRALNLYFPRVEFLSDLNSSMIYSSLSEFTFIVGRHSKRIISRLPSNVEILLERWGVPNRCLKYINGEGIPEVIKKILQHTTAFHLDRHFTVNNLTEFGIENMKQLQCCVLGECNQIQVIIDGNEIHVEEEDDTNNRFVCESSSTSNDTRIGLESLEFMYIYYMMNLKTIWKGPVRERCLSHLNSLTLSTCPQLTTIFTVGLLNNLHSLEGLTIRDCPAIKSLVSCEEGVVKQSDNYLPKLKSISLHYVPQLISIFSEVCMAPELEEMSLYNCPKLKSLSINEVSNKRLRKITGEKDWWEALEWKHVQPRRFDGIFVPINADECF